MKTLFLLAFGRGHGDCWVFDVNEFYLGSSSVDVRGVPRCCDVTLAHERSTKVIHNTISWLWRVSSVVHRSWSQRLIAQPTLLSRYREATNTSE